MWETAIQFPNKNIYKKFHFIVDLKTYTNKKVKFPTRIIV